MDHAHRQCRRRGRRHPGWSLALLLAVAALAADPATETRPFLGVSLGDSQSGGVVVRRVHPDTAAAAADLRAGDVVLRLEGRRTRTPGALQEAVAALQVGDRVRLEVFRDGERVTLHAVLGRRPDELALRRDRADQILEVLGLRPGQTVADIGCGSGWLSRAIAEVVGESGRVYAVEIDEGHVRALRDRPTPNVVPVLSRPDDVGLERDVLDVAVLHDVASHIDEEARKGFYDSVREALRPGGRLVVFGPHGRARAMLETLRHHGFIPAEPGTLEGLSPRELDARLDQGIVLRPGTAGP